MCVCLHRGWLVCVYPQASRRLDNRWRRRERGRERAQLELVAAVGRSVVGADEPEQECTIGGCSAEDGGGAGRNLFIPRNCHLPAPASPLRRRLLLILGGGGGCGERAEQWPEIAAGSLQFIRRRYCSPRFGQPRDRDRCAAAGPYCALARAPLSRSRLPLASWQIIMSDTRTHAQTPTQ